jgi:hypothetical protein
MNYSTLLAMLYTIQSNGGGTVDWDAGGGLKPFLENFLNFSRTQTQGAAGQDGTNGRDGATGATGATGRDGTDANLNALRELHTAAFKAYSVLRERVEAIGGQDPAVSETARNYENVLHYTYP